MDIKDLIQKFEDVKAMAKDLPDSVKSDRDKIIRLCDNVLLDYKVEQRLHPEYTLEQVKKDALNDWNLDGLYKYQIEEYLFPYFEKLMGVYEE